MHMVNNGSCDEQNDIKQNSSEVTADIDFKVSFNSTVYYLIKNSYNMGLIYLFIYFC